ncbi:hypothetical protein [Flavobacterium sp. W21_SRS_FM6]|uniref:hypothetical protein n=1 Tax=Flavobacterium sp. W21_SRS_FM6 TaxID=3240268 RepID=UPI003F8E207B
MTSPNAGYVQLRWGEVLNDVSAPRLAEVQYLLLVRAMALQACSLNNPQLMKARFPVF